MRLLARPVSPDPIVRCGASGAASIGGLLAVMNDPQFSDVKARLQLGPGSCVLGLVTEGVTDPALFEKVLARP
jgi:diaminopropionate ammonia-lyase